MNGFEHSLSSFVVKNVTALSKATYQIRRKQTWCLAHPEPPQKAHSSEGRRAHNDTQVEKCKGEHRVQSHS